MDFETDFDREVRESAKGVREAIELAATRENAQAYAETDEKFTFCIDLLGVSAHHSKADLWVNELEDKFDEINQKTSA